MKTGSSGRSGVRGGDHLAPAGRHPRTRSLGWSVLLLSVLASACTDGLSGEYGTVIDGHWQPVMTFKGGKVEIDIMVQTLRLPYTLREGRLHIMMGDEVMVFSINGRGCIDGAAMPGELCRKP